MNAMKLISWFAPLFVLAVSEGVCLTPAQADEPAWTVISAELTAKLAAEGKQSGGIGKSGGIAVDPKSGDVYLVMSQQGLWKSADQGESFERVDGGAVDGRCANSFALSVDPAGGRLMCFMIYGSSGLTTDGGKSFVAAKSKQFNCGTVDWEATGKTMLAYRHDSGETLAISHDAGATWKDLGKGFEGRLVGVFSPQILISTKGDGILRSTDAGGSWEKVSDAKTVSAVVKVRGGVGYVLTKEGLLVTKDQGATWSRKGSPVEALAGPYFGKDEARLIVAGPKGVMETTDGGESWSKVASLPPNYALRGLGIAGGQPNFGFDPDRNILYAAWLNLPAYKLQR
jgi:photosystem II stability/assembly factor-like uncharacterized protein